MNHEIKTQSVKKNLIFQILYQTVVLVIPLVISPYLTRTLGDHALGIYSYTYAYAYYFFVFAMLGIMRHGQRIVASRRNDKTALRKAFWSLYCVHLMVSVVALAAYFIFVFSIDAAYRPVYLVQGIFVASSLFDITWLFYGLENFRSVVVKNFLIKILECALIFTLVKSPDDVWIYTLIMAGSVMLGILVLQPQAIRAVPPIRFGWRDMKEHFKPLCILFIAVVASTLYNMFDKTLLGLLATKADVAYYDYSNKIILVPKTIIGAIGTVMMPRACACVARNDEASAKKYMGYSLHFVCLLGIGSVFGLLGVARLFAVLYYGYDWAICGEVIIALSPIILIIGLGDILRTQYMVPNGMDKQLSISFVLNAVLNLVLSVALIPVMGIYGAVVGTLAAEIFGLAFQLVLCRKFLSFGKILLTTVPYLVAAAVMYGVIWLIKQYFNRSIADLLLQIAVGGGIYAILSTVYLFCFSPLKHKLRAIVQRMVRRGGKDRGAAREAAEAVEAAVLAAECAPPAEEGAFPAEEGADCGKQLDPPAEGLSAAQDMDPEQKMVAPEEGAVPPAQETGESGAPRNAAEGDCPPEEPPREGEEQPHPAESGKK